MNEVLLHFAVRTPLTEPFAENVASVRLPTVDGQVGLRPRGEAMVLAVEPGLIVVRGGAEGGETDLAFIATAGGLLESGRTQAVLLTPLAAVGGSEDEMLAALDRMRAAPDSALLARHRLEELEQRILHELQSPQRRSPPAKGAG